MEIPDSSAARARRLTDPSIPPLRRQRASAQEAASPTDKIEVSPEARSLEGTDDLTRARLIAYLRGQVDAGTYTVDPSELARRLAELGEA